MTQTLIVKNGQQYKLFSCLIMLSLVNLSSASLQKRVEMSDWNIIANPLSTSQCVSNFNNTTPSANGLKATTPIDYCCLNHTVQVTTKQDGTNTVFMFSTQTQANHNNNNNSASNLRSNSNDAIGVGTDIGCKYFENELFAHSNNNVTDPQLMFQWGDNQQIMQIIKFIVNQTTFVDEIDQKTKIKYILQIPANLLYTSTDRKVLQYLSYIEDADNTNNKNSIQNDNINVDQNGQSQEKQQQLQQ